MHRLATSTVDEEQYTDTMSVKEAALRQLKILLATIIHGTLGRAFYIYQNKFLGYGVKQRRMHAEAGLQQRIKSFDIEVAESLAKQRHLYTERGLFILRRVVAKIDKGTLRGYWNEYKRNCPLIDIAELTMLARTAVDKDVQKGNVMYSELRMRIRASATQQMVMVVQRRDQRIVKRLFTSMTCNFVEAEALRTAMQWANMARGNLRQKKADSRVNMSLIYLMRRYFGDGQTKAIRSCTMRWRARLFADRGRLLADFQNKSIQDASEAP